MKAALTRCLHGSCPLQGVLVPLSWLFGGIAALRRLAYRLHLLATQRLPVPVIVVGNITVGGTGKTPLVIWLAAILREAGFHPGIISRGYGGQARAPAAVPAQGDAAVFGDEPVLLARRTGCPVWVGRRRPAVGRALLAAHAEVDVLISDDGLQHYALGRDLEIAVVDGERRFGNGRLLPAGPLREPVGRLDAVDAVVVNGAAPGWPKTAAPVLPMHLQPLRLRALTDPARTMPCTGLDGRPVHALAGIGNPGRFFATLAGLGMRVTPHAFADHHAYTRADLPDGTLVMTEKDAVKCAPLMSGAPPGADGWVLEVDAVPDPGLKTLIANRLKRRDGRKTS